MINDFLELPIFLVIIITIVAGAGFSFFILTIIRKFHDWESFKENHEVGGFLFNALGLIYATLIAFVVFATWEEYNSALENCEREAIMLQGIHLVSVGLPEEYQPVIKSKIIDYLNEVIKNDWPLMAVGKANHSSRIILLELWRIFEGMELSGNIENKIYAKQSILFREALHKLNEVTDYRRLRILSSQNHIPVMMWAVILIGALTSVGFSLFFGTKSFKVQALMTSLFAVTNALIFLLILNLDNPFLGDIKIKPEVYEEIAKLIENS